MTGTCGACGHEQPRDDLYAQAGPNGAGLYCRNHNSCQTRRKANFTNQRKATTMSDPKFNWDNPDYRVGDYWKWDTPGQVVRGTITHISTHTFPAKQQPDGTVSSPKTVPVITVGGPDGQSVEVTCSNADLLDQVRRAAPQVGDRIEITYLRDIPTSFGGKKKIFSVNHAKMEAQQADPWAGGTPVQAPLTEQAPF